MTEAEAIKFLQGRRRDMVSTRHLSVGEVITKVKGQSIAMACFGLMLIVFATINASKVQSGYLLLLKITEVIIAFSLIGLSAWRFIRLRQACRMLNYTMDGSNR